MKINVYNKAFRSICESQKENQKYLIQDSKIRDEFKENSRIRYLSDFSDYPVTKNNEVKYYSLGEEMFEDIIKELKKAQKYIFLEFFIISPGKLWNSILEILKEKAASGVDVRIMYDALGCFTRLSKSYPKELEKNGIKCVVFKKINPIPSIIMKNRDHRKIIVIDGKVAFTGGMNIGDEYININSKYGHWKDSGIRISGDGVWNFTVMYLTNWKAFRNEDIDFKKFKYDFKDSKVQNGYVIPYGESSLDDVLTCEDVYLNIINQANDSVYIFTPYLIVDKRMCDAIQLAVKRGVDVRIIIPGIPDKKIVYALTEAYAKNFLNYGVKIYKYIPGFLHSKVLIADNHIAVVGTINMDYRSLHLYFECGCYLENVDVIKDIKSDFDNTISKSYQITKENAKPNIFKILFQVILRIFAPLM